MWFIPVVCKYVQCQSIIIDLSWGLLRFKYCFSLVVSSWIILYRFCVCHLPMIYIWRCHFRYAKFPKRLVKTGFFRQVLNLKLADPRIEIARWAAIHPSSNCTTHSRDPLCDRSILSDSRLTGDPRCDDMMNMRKTHGFPTMLSKAPRTSNGQDFKAQQNIETIADVLWSFGSRDTSFGTGKLYLITNCLVNHRCRTVTFQID